VICKTVPFIVGAGKLRPILAIAIVIVIRTKKERFTKALLRLIMPWQDISFSSQHSFITVFPIFINMTFSIVYDALTTRIKWRNEEEIEEVD
jgi:hypothetical protein